MKRRSFGRLICRKDRGGQWYAKYQDPADPRTESGTTKYVVRRVASEREGKLFLKQVEAALGLGTYQAPQDAPESMTVDAAIRAYLASAEAAGRRSSTIETYGRIRERVLESGLGTRDVGAVTIDHVEAHLRHRRKTVGGTMLRMERSLLVSVYRRLIKRKVVTDNPVAAVAVPKRDKRTRRTFAPSELRRFLDACGPALRVYVLAGIYSGMRRGELIELRWRDVDLECGIVHVCRTKTRNATKLALHPHLLAELQALRVGRIVHEDSRVLLNTRAGPWTPSSLKANFARALKRGGLAGRGLVPYSTRHTFAASFAGPVRDLMQALGHRRLSTTQIYLDEQPERMNAAVARLDYGLQPGTLAGTLKGAKHAQNEAL